MEYFVWQTREQLYYGKYCRIFSIEIDANLYNLSLKSARISLMHTLMY